MVVGHFWWFVSSLALCLDDANQGPIVYGAEFGVPGEGSSYCIPTG